MKLFTPYRKAYYEYIERFDLETLQEKCRNNPLIIDKHNIGVRKKKYY